MYIYIICKNIIQVIIAKELMRAGEEDEPELARGGYFDPHPVQLKSARDVPDSKRLDHIDHYTAWVDGGRGGHALGARCRLKGCNSKVRLGFFPLIFSFFIH